MRDIRFRCWDNVNECMRPVYMLHFTDDEPMNIQTSMQEWINGKDAILMQFTGLKDKNGKEIYEGDVMHYKPYVNNSNYEANMEVKFNDGAFYLSQGVGKTYEICAAAINSCAVMEVIGNVWEHPELLKP